MKSHIKRGYLFIFFILVYILGQSDIQDYRKPAFFLAFFTSVVVLYIIKNTYVAHLISLLLIIGCSVYNISYAVFIIPPYLLILVYRSIIKKIRLTDSKKKHNIGVGHTGLHFLILLGLAEIIYVLVKSFDNEFYAYYKDAVEIVGLTVALVVIFAVGSFSKKAEQKAMQDYKVSKNDYITLNLVNFVGMFLFLSSLAVNYGAYQDLQVHYTVMCFAWSVWMCVLVYEKNPVTEVLLDLIKEKIKEVSERRIK